jgi:NAD+ synthase
MSTADRIAAWLADYADSAGARGFVFGLSGGVDSAVVAALAARAAGAENTLGALMPCHSTSDDERLGKLVADTFAIPTVRIDLTPTFNALLQSLPKSGHPLAGANVKPRLRMTVLYYLAQSNSYLVLGSGNESELAVGYFTKFGDGACDLLPLGGLYKTQVWQLAAELGVPQEVIDRPPSAGLWQGQTDEAELGITYRELDRVLAAAGAGDTSEIDADLLDRVQEMIARSEHKRAPAPVFHAE